MHILPALHPESLHHRIVKLTAIRGSVSDMLAKHPGDRALNDLYSRVCERLSVAQSQAEKLLRHQTAEREGRR